MKAILLTLTLDNLVKDLSKAKVIPLTTSRFDKRGNYTHESPNYKNLVTTVNLESIKPKLTPEVVSNSKYLASTIPGFENVILEFVKTKDKAVIVEAIKETGITQKELIHLEFLCPVKTHITGNTIVFDTEFYKEAKGIVILSDPPGKGNVGAIKASPLTPLEELEGKEVEFFPTKTTRGLTALRKDWHVLAFTMVQGYLYPTKYSILEKQNVEQETLHL